MPFFEKNIKNCTSLLHKNRCVLLDMYSTFYPQRRVSLFRGSITVETALVLPVFLFAMLSVLMFCEAVRFSDNVSVLIHQNAKELAMYGYALKYTDWIPSGKTGEIAFSEIYVKNKVKKGLAEKKQMTDIVTGKDGGIQYLHSKILENEIIDISASYEIQLPYSIPGIGKFKAADRARIRAWTGYDNTNTEHLKEKQEIVFIAADSEVYHKDRECRHIHVKVRTVLRKNLPVLRNKNGGKYYKCGYCKGGSDGTVYLTDYGDRYHESTACSRLKRDVYPVPLQEAGDRRPCKTCGL